MEENTQRNGVGRWRKGFTPWNKGKHTGGREAVKGRQGYPSRPVVVINYDGTVLKRFPSVKATQEYFGRKDRHSVIYACTRGTLCGGYRMMYEEDYVPWADYHYAKPRFYDSRGWLMKGHNYNSWKMKLTPEGREKQRATARRTARRMVDDPNCRFGKVNHNKPIVCVSTGERFPSIKDCAIKLGIAPNQISAAITRRGTTHGYTFQKETSL